MGNDPVHVPARFMHTDDKMLCVTAPFYYFKKNIMSTRKPISMYLVN